MGGIASIQMNRASLFVNSFLLEPPTPQGPQVMSTLQALNSTTCTVHLKRLEITMRLLEWEAMARAQYRAILPTLTSGKASLVRHGRSMQSVDMAPLPEQVGAKSTSRASGVTSRLSHANGDLKSPGVTFRAFRFKAPSQIGTIEPCCCSVLATGCQESSSGPSMEDIGPFRLAPRSNGMVIGSDPVT